MENDPKQEFKEGSRATFTYYLESQEKGTRLWSRVSISIANWLIKVNT
jgi:hypothetical protein